MGQASLTPAKAWGIVDAMPTKILNGTATPEEERLFDTAMNIAIVTTEYIDPYTGQLVTRRTGVPAHAQDAAALLNSRRAEGAGQVPSGVAETPRLGQRPETVDQQSIPVYARDALAIDVRDVNTENYGQPGVASIFNASENATGPVSVISAAAYRTPVLNLLANQTAGEALEAGRFVSLATSAITEGFRAGTDRFTTEERKYLLETLGTLPGLLYDQDAYRRNLFALDELLQRKQQATVARYRSNFAEPNIVRAAQEELFLLHEIRALVGVPLHINAPDDPRLEGVVRRYPVGTSFLVVNDPSVTGISRRTITQEMKDRVSGGQ
jgi:hypothetical protein